MSADLWLISDLHGCYHTFRRLLAKLPQGAQIVLCGDLIDRGPHSRQMVEYAMEHGIPTVMGNHESLCLFYHGRGHNAYSDRALWALNGGIDALKSWFGDPLPKNPAGWRLPDDVLDWMEALPYHLDYGELLVSHTGHALSPLRADIFGRKDPVEMRLWYRDDSFPNDGRFRVYGHTQEQQPVITATRAMIDTGAAYPEYGVMTAFHWPSKRVVQQTFDESPL